MKNLKLKEPGDGMGAKFFCDQIVAGKTTYKNHTTIWSMQKHFHEHVEEMLVVPAKYVYRIIDADDDLAVGTESTDQEDI